MHKNDYAMKKKSDENLEIRLPWIKHRTIQIFDKLVMK